MRGLLLSCIILAAAASSVCTDAHTWSKKLSSFASGSSPDGEAPPPRGENNTHVWGLLLFVVAFNVVGLTARGDDDDEVLRDIASSMLFAATPEEREEPPMDVLFAEEEVLPATASKLTRLMERVDWNAWYIATITGEYDPGHSTVPRWRARGRAAIIRDTAQRLGMDEAFVRREAARRDFWGEAYERDVDLAELDLPDGCRTPPRVHYPIP